MSATGGTTVIRESTPRILFDMNTGRHYVEMNPALSPLAVQIDDVGRRVRLEGNRLVVSPQCDTSGELSQVIEEIYFGLKLLLAIDFSDPPTVERVDGVIGSVPFRWELQQWQWTVLTTTQQLGQERAATAWRRRGVDGDNRRLLGAAYVGLAGT